MKKCVLLLLVLTISSVSFAQQMKNVDLSSVTWDVFSDSKLLTMVSDGINVEAWSHKYTNAEEDDYQDLDDKVIYRGCYTLLPQNEEGCKITFRVENLSNSPGSYIITKVKKNGKEEKNNYRHGIYWGYGVAIEDTNGNLKWHTAYFLNYRSTTSYMEMDGGRWIHSKTSFTDIDVSIIFNATKNVASINGKLFQNVKSIGGISLFLGPAARLTVSNFKMKVGDISNTGWNEDAIRENIDKNNDGLCGLYLVGDYTLGVVKISDKKYQILFVDGFNEKEIWNVGDVYASGEKTALPGIIAFRREMDDRRIYMAVDGMTMRWSTKPGGCFLDDAEIYIKMYPSSNGTVLPGPSADSQQSSSGKETYTSQGSGFFITKEGVIATNYHVVCDATKYDVVVKDGTSVKTYSCKLLSTDKTNDLALLQIDDPTFTPLIQLPYSIKTKQCEVGTKCYAYGYPYEQILGSEVKITDGMISSRTGFDGDVVRYQITVPITRGNSGGPLFDEHGNLIGVTSSGVKAELAQNTNYAIKASYLQNIIDAAPIDIEAPAGTVLQGMSLVEQIKVISPYTVCVKVK